MTREEAIDILRSYLMFDKSSMQIDIALNMAIEALSADMVSFETQVESTLQVLDDFAKDRVKVVRCKDCRHRDLFSCPLADNDFQKDDDYCSWGERREEVNGFKSVGQAWNTSQERR